MTVRRIKLKSIQSIIEILMLLIFYFSGFGRSRVVLVLSILYGITWISDVMEEKYKQSYKPMKIMLGRVMIIATIVALYMDIDTNRFSSLNPNMPFYGIVLGFIIVFIAIGIINTLIEKYFFPQKGDNLLNQITKESVIAFNKQYYDIDKIGDIDHKETAYNFEKIGLRQQFKPTTVSAYVVNQIKENFINEEVIIASATDMNSHKYFERVEVDNSKLKGRIRLFLTNNKFIMHQHKGFNPNTISIHIIKYDEIESFNIKDNALRIQTKEHKYTIIFRQKYYDKWANTLNDYLIKKTHT